MLAAERCASATSTIAGNCHSAANLSGFRGALGAADVVGDLAREPFADAQQRLHRLAVDQADRRLAALAALERAGEEAGLATGSPCLFCLGTLGKTPWTTAAMKGIS